MPTTSLLKKGIAIGIILLFLGIAFVLGIGTTAASASEGSNPSQAKSIHLNDDSPIRFPLITFNSDIILTYNETYVNNETFTPCRAYSIPIQIGYRAEVPYWLLHYHFRPLKNWFLFHSFIAPNMVINMSAKSTQSWAMVYPVVSNILTDIQNEYVFIQSTVIVDLGVEAPQGPFVFSVTAQTLTMHRINGFETTMTIPIMIQ
jgi:hypothetical protein